MGYIFNDTERAAAREALGMPPMQRIAKVRADLEDTPTPVEQPAAVPAAPSRRSPSMARWLGAAAALLAIAALITAVMLRPATPLATNDERRTTTPGPAVAGSQPAGLIEPAGQAAPAVTPAAPTEGATIAAYAAPGGALLGPIPADSIIKYRYGNTSWGGVDWHGRVVWIEADHPPPASYPDLAKPTPAPTVERVYVEVPIEPACDQEINPRYTAQIDVYDGSRPLGIAVGRSCISQADAQANADALAAAMKGATP